MSFEVPRVHLAIDSQFGNIELVQIVMEEAGSSSARRNSSRATEARRGSDSTNSSTRGIFATQLSMVSS